MTAVMERVSSSIQSREPVDGANRTEGKPKFTPEPQGEPPAIDGSVVLAGNVPTFSLRKVR